MVRDVEEVDRAEVIVAALVARADAAHVDGHLDARLCRVFCDDDCAVNAHEATADLGEAEVAAHEGDLGVAGVDLPGASCGELDAREGAGFGLELDEFLRRWRWR